jgi:hypothetical protein
MAWVGIANGDDLAVGLDGNATQPVGAAAKIGEHFAGVAKCRVKIPICGQCYSQARQKEEKCCYDKKPLAAEFADSTAISPRKRTRALLSSIW